MPVDRAEKIVASATPAPKTTKTPTRQMRAKFASAIEPTKVEWLWPGWLPAGRLALFGGKPGDGKSGVAIDLAARASRGLPFPDGYRPPRPLTVLLLSAEDDPSDTLVPRLLAAGADLERVVIANGSVVDAETGLSRPWTLPGDVDVLGALVREHHVELAVIDPLGAFVSTAADTHRDSSVRGMLLPLAQMARKERCAVLAIRHHRKGGAADARDAGTGSVAFTAAARIEWVAGRDPQDQGRRILAVAKTNIGREPTSLAYRLVSAEDAYDTVRIAWDGTSHLTASQLTSEPMSEEDRSAVDEAGDFLRTVLSEGGVPAKDVKRQAAEAGISETAALRRAKERLRVRSRKTSTGTWLRELPTQGEHRSDEGELRSEHAHLAHVAPLAHLPSTHTLINEGFSRETVEDEQGEQGDVLGPPAHLPYSDDEIEAMIAEYEGEA